MTTATLPKSVFFISDGFGIEHRVYAKQPGSKKKTYAGVAVFRSGTFRDSIGIQNTWEEIHIKQMVDNFNHLRNKNIVASIPARDGHPTFIVGGMQGKGNVVGWHDDIEVKRLKSPVDGKEYDYLLADYTITEDYAQEKLDNGTWRNRSAEIVTYTTNDEAEFWPVYLGFAFVDFPAVEGLNFSSLQGSRLYVMFNSTDRTTNEETSVSGNTGTGQVVGQGTGQGATGQPGAPVLPFSLPTPPVQQTQPTYVFSINGQNVSDPATVQGHVNRLEQFVRETRDSARKAFVAGLVSKNLLSAPQQSGMEEFALTLSDEQFEVWTKQWDAAVPPSILSQHGTGAAGSQGQPGQKADQATEDAKAIVAMHRRMGMPQDQLKKTGSYQKLVAAGIEQA